MHETNSVRFDLLIPYAICFDAYSIMKKKKIPALIGGRHPENRLQQARVNAGVTQEQIAEALACDTRTIQRYEAGEQSPTLSTLLKMGDCYSCEIADLFPEKPI